MLRWKLPFFKGQGYINRVIPVSGWFVLTFTCWTWPRMTRSGSRRRTGTPTEDAGGGVAWWESWQSQHAITFVITRSGHAFSFQKWNCKEQFRSLALFRKGRLDELPKGGGGPFRSKILCCRFLLYICHEFPEKPSLRKEGRGGIEAQAFVFRSWSNVRQIKSKSVFGRWVPEA